MTTQAATTDAETTPNPSCSPCDKRWVLQLTRCAVCAPPLATHRPPLVSSNQGSRLAPCPSPPRMAAHLRTPTTPTNDETAYANGNATHERPAKQTCPVAVYEHQTSPKADTQYRQDHKRRQQEVGMKMALCTRCCEVKALPLHTFQVGVIRFCVVNSCIR